MVSTGNYDESDFDEVAETFREKFFDLWGWDDHERRSPLRSFYGSLSPLGWGRLYLCE